jgi:hypothetical protein
MSAAVQVTETLNYGAGKDAMKRILNGNCVGKKMPVEI